ncbi:retinaldehyde-binding protein 1 [Caerostris extrusa]|uniref:Retinaldehyde-binding protein 1 n=1 Tax=Caerostris extrusa TaxID=172846 RepID=A0AAV4MTI7_CAEEX|nr:retinaldehyde-binding protein 1 [Caerostris extrusa]
MSSDDNSIVHDRFFVKIGSVFYLTEQRMESVILVIKVGMWDPEKVDRDLLMWVITHCMIHSIECEATQVAGYSAIVDVRGVTHKHLKLLTIENILLIIHSTQHCFPDDTRPCMSLECRNSSPMRGTCAILLS